MLIERQADFSIIEANHEFLRLSNLPRPEVLGKTCQELGWHCSETRRQQFYQQALSQDSVREFEMVVVWAGVSRVLLLASEQLSFQGEPALLITLQDITGRKEADDRFASTFYHSPVPMAIMRLSDLTYVEANHEFLQLTRLTREQFNGKTDVEAGFEVDSTARQLFFDSILTQDSVRNYELKVRYRQRELTLLISSEKIVFQGEPCLLGSFQDITYRTESEARFAKVFHANPIAMTLIRVQDQRIIEVNESTLRLTGIPRSELLGKSVPDLQLNIASQNWRELLDQLTATGTLKDFEFRVRYPTGEHVVLACAETLVFNGECCILWSQQDITERQLAEERFTKAFHASPHPMAISRLRDHRIIEVNDCMGQLAGLTRAEMLGRTRAELGIPLDALAKLAIYTQVQTTGSIRNYEVPVTLKTGSHTLLYSGDTITLNGESCLLWAVQDITARKQAEELFSKAFHFTPHPMTLFTLRDQKYVRVNAAWEELTGYQLIHAAGRTLEELNHWVNESQRRDFIRQLEETGRVRDFEAELLAFDGQHKQYLISAETMYFNGQPHVLSLGNDITARKQAEAALRESERRLTLALEAAKMGVYTFEVPTQQVYWSPECHRIFGVEEFHGSLAEVQRQLYPADREYVLKMAAQALAGQSPLEMEFRIVRPDGTVRWVNDRGRATYDSSGKPLRQIGVVQDITERKQAEQALRRWADAFEHCAHGIAIGDPETNCILYSNPAFARLRGVPVEQVAGLRIWELYAPGERERVRELLSEADERGQVQFEAQLLRGNGAAFFAQIDVVCVKDETGARLYRVATIQDITQRQQVQAALRESEERHRIALEATNLGTWRRDLATTVFKLDERARTQLGLTTDEWSLDEVRAAVHPEDAERVGQQYRQLVQPRGEGRYADEFRVICGNGEVRWLAVTGQIYFEGTGETRRAVSAVGTLLDITERKLAEERFSKAFHANPIPMSIVRARDRVILEINRAFLELADWERGEVLGHTFAEIGFDVGESLREEVYPQLATGAAVHNREVRIQFKQGLRILLSSAEPLTLNGEACILWSNQDVTELKAAEERFTKAFHANPIPMALLRISDRRVFEINRRFEQISGLPRSAVIGKSVDEAGVQIDPQQRDAFNHQLLTTGSARDFEFEVAYPNNVRTVLASAELITLGGEPCVLLSQQDITERKQAEERFTKAFNANPNPMALLALPSTEYVQVNDAWLALAGYDRAATIGKCANELNNWVDQEQRDEFYRLLLEQGYVRDFEAHVHPPGQRERLFQISGEIVQINGQPHLLSCSIDITERKQAELALQASEERFRTLAATSQAAISMHNDERFLYANQAAEELYGYTSAELAQLSPWSLVHPDSEMTIAGLRDTLQQEQPAPWRDEVKIITKSGELRWVEAAVGFVELQGQRCYLVTSFDITSRKETREALRLSEERFATAFNSSPEAMSLSTFNEDRLVLVNDACLRLWGLAREATLGRSLSKLNLWVDPNQGELAYQTVRETGALHNFEAQVYLANGEIGYILVSAEVVELGTERFVLSVSKNITERKRAEAAIQASETRFRTLTESSPMAILIFDEQRFYYANPAAIEMFGYSQAEFAHLSLRHVLDAESWVSIGHVHSMRRWYGDAVSQRHEVIITTKSGQKRWIDYSSTSIELDGQPRYILTAIDITKRKSAEAAIQASEIRFRTLAESSQAAILIFDDKQYLYANPAASELFGYTAREFHSLHWRDLLHPDYYALMAERRAAYEREGQVPQRDEALIITKSGEHRWIDYSLGIAEIDGKERFIVTALDITQRRQMEAALQASETRFRTLTESSQAAIVIYDRDHMIYANPAAERLFGYSLAEITHMKVLDVVHPDSLEYVSSLLTANVQGDTTARRNEFKIVRKDGQARWIDSAGASIEIEGKPLRIVTSFDITERKQAEEALRLSEERFALTFDACPDAMALTTYEGGKYVMVNQAWFNLYGLTKAQVIAQTFIETEIWGNSEQRRYVYQIVRERGAFRNFEVKTKQPNGETAYLLASAEVVRLGEEQFVLAVSKDITERKRVEAALLASEAKFRTLAETSQAATLIYDEDKFVYANPAAECLLGYSQVEIMALTIWEVLHPDAHARVRELRAALQSGENINLTEELQILTKAGESRWINAAVASIQIGGKAYRLVTAFDVTERRQAEEYLRVSQDQLRNLAARLQEVREEERAAISREIHDELGQSLTGMKMDLKWLEKQLPPDTPDAQQRLASLYELINSTIQNVRKLASSLRPGILDDFGLVAALEWLVQDYAKRTSISCRLLELPEDFPLDRERATAVFRICQEALTNIARHAQATEVAVRLTHADAALCLEVRDNGKGITADEINHIRSLGLVGMRERALLLGGSFNIHGTPGQGTTVVVQIPLIVPTGESHD